MVWWFKNKKKHEEDYVNIWKQEFSDCTTLDYLPDYSVCKNKNNKNCRFVAMYAGMTLCGNPKHKTYISEGSEPFNPHKGQFND